MASQAYILIGPAGTWGAGVVPLRDPVAAHVFVILAYQLARLCRMRLEICFMVAMRQGA